MSCAGCHAENEEHRRYCGACGSPLNRPCAACSFNNRVTDCFCGGCGGKLVNAQVRRPPVPSLVPGPGQASSPSAPTVAPTAAVPNGTLSLSEMRALLPAAVAPVVAKPLDNKVSQAELDALFGGA